MSVLKSLVLFLSYLPLNQSGKDNWQELETRGSDIEGCHCVALLWRCLCFHSLLRIEEVSGYLIIHARYASIDFFFFLEKKFCYVTKAGFKLRTPLQPPKCWDYGYVTTPICVCACSFSVILNLSLSQSVSRSPGWLQTHELVEDDLECIVDNSEMVDTTQNFMPAKPVSHILTLAFLFW